MRIIPARTQSKDEKFPQHLSIVFKARGGGEVNQWTDGGVPFWPLIGTQKFNFHVKILLKNLFYKILCLLFHQEKLCLTNIFSRNGW